MEGRTATQENIRLGTLFFRRRYMYICFGKRQREYINVEIGKVLHMHLKTENSLYTAEY